MFKLASDRRGTYRKTYIRLEYSVSISSASHSEACAYAIAYDPVGIQTSGLTHGASPRAHIRTHVCTIPRAKLQRSRSVADELESLQPT
jgi:hypothetical protein